MELDYLRDALAVARAASFSAAAVERSLAQSTLSKHIAACEAELGVRLFERDSSGAHPTPLGEVFLETAASLLRDYDDVLARLRELRCVTPETLRIATYRGQRPIDDLVAAVRLALRRRAPLLTLAACDIEYADPLDDVLQGRVDVAEVLIAAASDLPSGLSARVLYSEPLDVVVPTGHRLADRESVHVDELSGETLWLPIDESFAEAWRADLELLERFGCRVEVGRRPWRSVSEAFCLDFDHGIQIQAASIWDNSIPLALKRGYRAIPIADEGFEIDVALAYRSDGDTPGLRAFLSAVDEVCAKTDFTCYYERGVRQGVR